MAPPPVIVHEFDHPYLRVHQFPSPAEGGGEAVNSYLLEFETGLLILDLPLLDSVAISIRDYADQLNKPILKVLISHAHPDHWFGLYRFQDFPSLATTKTIDEIREQGANYLAFKQAQTTTPYDLPQGAIVPATSYEGGEETIDGVTLIWRKACNVEYLDGLYLEIPIHQILISGDLVYNHVHHYVGQKDEQGKLCISHWIDMLNTLRVGPFNSIFPGHGAKGGMELIEDSIAYLGALIPVVTGPGANEPQYRQYIKDNFADFDVIEMVDISAYFLLHQP